MQAGKDKGKVGTVLEVLRKQNRLRVSGVHMLKKNKRGEAGVHLETEGSLHVSNVALVDPSDGKPCRVRYEWLENYEIYPKLRHAKVRVSTRTGTTILKPDVERRSTEGAPSRNTHTRACAPQTCRALRG